MGELDNQKCLFSQIIAHDLLTVADSCRICFGDDTFLERETVSCSLVEITQGSRIEIWSVLMDFGWAEIKSH